MTKITLHTNEYCDNKLEEIVAEMEKLGRPIIRGHFHEEEDAFKAIEGAHRLRACEMLGVVPYLDPIEDGTLIEDIDDLDYVAEHHEVFIEEIGSWDNYSIKV